MKRTFWVAAIPTFVLASVVGAFAGGDHACKGSIEDCAKKIVQKSQSAGWLGVETEKGDHGFYVVSRVVEGSPAAAAGFEAGDVLVALNGVKLADENKEKLHEIKAKLGPGADVTYTVKRKGGKLDLAARLATMPESVVAQNIGEHILASHLQMKVAAK